ncbi:MAG: SIMPL domain-containing protein [Desulfofustis sp.]|nr:SIMPL domain-containing protein [Desulfofustis sp.]
MKLIVAFSSALIVLIATIAIADEPVQFNIVNLRVEQTREVSNDVMVVVMQTTAQKNSSTEAARSVNEVMAWADKIISEDQRISHQTLNYQTRPVYQNKTITGWSASQQLQLRSQDIEALTTMAGSLQQKLQIVSMQFQVSPDRRAEELETLVVEALEAFHTKAELVTRTLNADDYRLVNLSIDESGGPMPYRAIARAEAMTVGAAPPSVEAGDSKIQVSVTGSIQLIF